MKLLFDLRRSQIGVGLRSQRYRITVFVEGFPIANWQVRPFITLDHSPRDESWGY